MSIEHKLEYLKIAVSFYCNQNCVFCSQQFKDRGVGLFPLDMLRRLLANQELMQNLRLIILTGGEPLVHYEHVKEITRIVKSRRLEIGIFTNATLMDDARAKELKALGVDWIRTNLLGSNAELHEAHMPGKSTFSDVIRGIKSLKDNGFLVKAKATITKKNVDDLSNILRLAMELGIDEFDFGPYCEINVKEVEEEFSVLPGSVLKAMDELLVLRREVKDRIKVSFLPSCYDYVSDEYQGEQVAVCNCGRKYLYVEPSGDVKVCPGYDHVIGNVKTDDIMDIWRNCIRLHHVRDLQPPDICKDCEYWQYCRNTGCFVMSYKVFGSVDHPNPKCPLVSKIKDQGGNVERSE